MKTTNVIKLVLAGLVLAVVYRMIVNRSHKGAMRELPGYSFPERYDQDSDDGEGYEDEYYGDQDATEEYMEAEAETYDDDGEETYDDDMAETYDEDMAETYDEDTAETYDEQDETEGFNDNPGDYPFTNAPPTGGVATNRLPNQGASSNPGNWKDFAPKNALDQNFMDAAMQIGVDTVSSSLKNPSYDLRNNVPIPKSYTVSPWMQSNIDPDLTRNPIF